MAKDPRKPEITPDEPYVPDMCERDKETLRFQNREWNAKALNHPAETPQRKVFKIKLNELSEKLADGRKLSDDELEYVYTQGLLLVIAESRRPSQHIAAIRELREALKKRAIDVEARDVTPEETTEDRPRLALPRRDAQ